MKKLIRVLAVLVLLVLVGLGVGYFYRNSLIRSAVESQASSSLGVKTTLGSANLSLFGGALSLGDLKIGSPDGYKADQMFTLGELGLGVNYSELRQDPVRVSKIVIEKPNVVVEMANGKFNFQALMDQISKGSSGGDKPADSSKPVKLIIDELQLNNAAVVVRAPMLPNEITVNVPSVTLKQIGNGDGAKNGAAIKDVIGASMSALASAAAKSPEMLKFGDLSKMLQEQAGAVIGNISKELGNQVNDLTKNVTGEITKSLGGDAGKAIEGVTGGKDPGKAVEDGLKGLIPGGKDDKKDRDKKKDK